MKKLSITCLAVLLTVSLVPLQVSAYTGKSDINTDRIMRDALNGPMTFLRNNPDVRQESKNNFKADFKNAKDVWWWRADNMDQVRFTLNGKKMIAYYNDFSKLIGTTVEEKISNVPMNGRDKIKREFSGYQIGNVILFHDNNRTGYSQPEIYGERYAYLNNYFVELRKGNDEIVLQVNPLGTVYNFTSLNKTSVG